MAYGDVLQHSGRIVRTTEGANWVAGEPDTNDDQPAGEPFPCCLFLPLASDTPVPRGTRRVTQPTLLLPSGLDLNKADKLEVTAPQVTGPAAVLWEVDAGPQPFGPPGNETVGAQCVVKRVEE